MAKRDREAQSKKYNYHLTCRLRLQGIFQQLCCCANGVLLWGLEVLRRATSKFHHLVYLTQTCDFVPDPHSPLQLSISLDKTQHHRVWRWMITMARQRGISSPYANSCSLSDFTTTRLLLPSLLRKWRHHFGTKLSLLLWKFLLSFFHKR